ncbi:MAG: maleylpyruvate isomerase N-terminal domain-containing protein [Acidimicrobiales bacterium]
MEPTEYLGVLAERSTALLGAAAGAMDHRVPTCPDWTLEELVVHVGLVWGWAADIVATRTRADLGQAPADRSDEMLRAWAAKEAARLAVTLGAADPDTDCWTFGMPRSVRFWFRRQALETVLHAWDAEGAVGTGSRIDPEVAADGVDEHLTVVVPRSVRRRPGAWSGETVHLHCTDTQGEWTVRLGPGDDVATERTHAKADVALRGPAEALWLWCANRGSPAELGIERFGDDRVVARWRGEMAF